MTFDGLMQTLRDRAGDLSPQLQRAAMLLETHQRDIALLSMRDLARRWALIQTRSSRYPMGGRIRLSSGEGVCTRPKASTRRKAVAPCATEQ